MNVFGRHAFIPNNDILTLAGQINCKEEVLTQTLCNNILFLIAGYDSEQLNKKKLPVILGHIPAGSSTKQIIHFGQLKKSRKFHMFDYGLAGNTKHYGRSTPPSYDLSKVTAPVTIHYAMNDWLADIQDVEDLVKLLPKGVKRYIVPSRKFNHLDFTLAIDMRKLVYDGVVESMKEIEGIFLKQTD